MTLCNAGHPVPMVYREATGEWTFLAAKETDADDTGADPVNLPLGIVDLADYQTFDVPLKKGDLVLCYTDSLWNLPGPMGIAGA